jgi:hypothetical protein
MAKTQELGRRSYAAVLFGLHRAERTGVLEVKQGRVWRKVYLVQGTPVLYESSVAKERLSKTLVQAGLVDEKPLSKIVTGLKPGEALETRLLLEGLVGPEELQAHKRSYLERGASAALTWKKPKFHFHSRDSVGTSIDPALLPLVHPLRGLWAATKQNVSMDEALPIANDPDAGLIQGTESLAAMLTSMAVEAPLDSLGALLSEGGLSFEGLFGKVGDKSGQLAPLIWLLEAVGLVTRSTKEADPLLTKLAGGVNLDGESPLFPEPVKKPSAPAPKAVEATDAAPMKQDDDGPSRTAAHLPQLLSTARTHRSGKDFYSFLDLESDARVDAITEALDRYTKLWQSAADTEGLPSVAVDDAQALLAAAARVRTVLLDPQSRESYNIKLDIAVSEDLIALEAQGDEVAVSEGDSDSELSVRLEAARKAIEGGDQSGVAILSQLRVLNPSDPNVLAELGWATWKFADEGNSSGQEFLQLALTFDPRHVLALEYLGKIAQSEDDVEQATDLAARVQKLEPENAWAKAALTTVPNEEKKAKKKSRFWRRGD